MKTKKPLFTICIPVYNSEKYIGFAIGDLLAQTFSDFECIVIDDKSPDQAIGVVEDMIGGNDKFTILKNKENLGVSATRNKGLSAARGEYVLFLDSDDRYDFRLLERIAEQIRKADGNLQKVDVITWEFGGVGPRNEKIKQLELWRQNELNANQKPTGLYNPQDVSDRLFQVNMNSMCVKCFRLEFIKAMNLRFRDDIRFGEDALFSYMAITAAGFLAVIPGDNILYYYRRDQDESAMHTIDLSRQMNYQLEMISELQKFLKERNNYELYQESFEKWVSDGVGSIAVRMNTVRAQKNLSIDEEIRSVVQSWPWRVLQFIKKIKNTL